MSSTRCWPKVFKICQVRSNIAKLCPNVWLGLELLTNLTKLTLSFIKMWSRCLATFEKLLHFHPPRSPGPASGRSADFRSASRARSPSCGPDNEWCDLASTWGIHGNTDVILSLRKWQLRPNLIASIASVYKYGKIRQSCQSWRGKEYVEFDKKATNVWWGLFVNVSNVCKFWQNLTDVA